MITKVTQTKTQIFITPVGFYKLLSLKSKLVIPKSSIVNVRHSPEEVEKFNGIRLPGTYIPYVVKAGTFYDSEDGSKVFLNIRKSANAIIFELKNHKFKRVMVEVDNPVKLIEQLNEI